MAISSLNFLFLVQETLHLKTNTFCIHTIDNSSHFINYLLYLKI